MIPVTPTAALMDLFAALFSDHELRAFFAHRLPGGDKIVGRLPGTPCTLEHIADQAAQVLERQGLVTRELFEALLATVPGRSIDIWRVATAWGIPEPSAPTPAAPAATSTTTTEGPGTWDVFVSYARADLAWVSTLAENLHGLGLRVFFDEWEISPGDVFVHRLDQGLHECRNGILVVTPTSMTRPWVMQEYAALLTRAVAKNLRLIPVLYADAEMPPMLATRAWIDLRGKTGEEYLEQVRRLARALKGESPGPRPLRAP